MRRQEKLGKDSNGTVDDSSGLHSVTRGCLGGVLLYFL